MTPELPLKLLELMPLAVRSFVTANYPESGIYVAAGWKARTRSKEGKLSGNRIVFTPDAGGMIAPTEPGVDNGVTLRDVAAAGTVAGPFPRRPIRGRQLYVAELQFEVSIWGYDPSSPATEGDESETEMDATELRHVRRCFELVTIMAQGLQQLGWGAFELNGFSFPKPRVELSHGVEMVQQITVRLTIEDLAPQFKAPPLAGVAHKGPAPDSGPPIDGE